MCDSIILFSFGFTSHDWCSDYAVHAMPYKQYCCFIGDNFGGENSDLSDRNSRLLQGVEFIRHFEKFCSRFEFATK